MPEPGDGGTPLGFASAEALVQFVSTLRDGLDSAGYPGTRVAFQGSSVTGASFRTGQPFDVGRVSDYDIALGGDGIFQAAKDSGASLRSKGTRTGPIKAGQLADLGLAGLQNELGCMAGRDVNFMIYQSLDDALSRGPSIEMGN
jgi:hypothetical protein